jgi:WXG100 family type VII secretion target
MNDRISAVEGSLARGADAVSGAHLDIHASTRRVMAELDELRAHWSGDAAGSYSQLVNQWSAGADRINNELVRLESALRETDRDQQAAEQQHQTTIGGLSAMLGGE